MKLIAGALVGVAAAGAFSAAALAEVRTYGPATPFLVTGRSVSVPPYHQGQQPIDGRGAKDDMAPQDASGRGEPLGTQPEAK